MIVEHLKKRKDFLYVSSSGDKVYSKGIILLYLKKEMDKDTLEDITIRVGFTVTKKIGNAVVRNRIKRRLRSVLYETLSKVTVNKAYDIVLIGRKHTIFREFSGLKKDLKYMLYTGSII